MQAIFERKDVIWQSCTLRLFQFAGLMEHFFILPHHKEFPHMSTSHYGTRHIHVSGLVHIPVRRQGGAELLFTAASTSTPLLCTNTHQLLSDRGFVSSRMWAPLLWLLGIDLRTAPTQRWTACVRNSMVYRATVLVQSCWAT